MTRGDIDTGSVGYLVDGDVVQDFPVRSRYSVVDHLADDGGIRMVYFDDEESAEAYAEGVRGK